MANTIELITKRPDDMDFDDYKLYMKIQKKGLKKYLKGRNVWISKLHPTPEILEAVAEEEYKEFAQLLTRGATYIKPIKDDDTRVREDLPKE